MIKKTLLRSIILLSLTLLLVNCSKDDDSPDSSVDTFLEKYENITWVLSSIDGVIWDGDKRYIKFNNNETNPIEYWIYAPYGGSCYDYFTSVSDGEFTEVIENSSDVLTLKYFNSEIGYFTENSTVVGGNLEKVDLYSTGDSQRMIYVKTNTTTDDFTICD